LGAADTVAGTGGGASASAGTTVVPVIDMTLPDDELAAALWEAATTGGVVPILFCEVVHTCCYGSLMHPLPHPHTLHCTSSGFFLHHEPRHPASSHR
jgi:hypothetical protein